MIIYIGKSHNMLRRIAQHMVGIKKQSELKYRLLAESQRKGIKIEYGVLYDASSAGYTNIENEIGYMEGEFIRKYRPFLNTQIPLEEDWHKYKTVPIDVQTARFFMT